MSLLARCPSCSKSFRVPHADKTWRCKLCDGELALEEQAEAPPGPLEDSPCPECGEPNPAGSAFCGGCGAGLGADEEEPAQRARRPRDKDREAERRGIAMANRFAKRTGRLKFMMQGIMSVNLVYALSMVFGYIGARNGNGLLFVPPWAFLVLTGFFLFCAFMGWQGIRQVDRRPLMTVLSLAGLYALIAIWAWIDGWGGLLTNPLVLSLWAVLLWALVPEAAAITREARENPDLYLAKKLRGEHLQHKDRHGREDSISRRTRRAARGQRRSSLGKQLAYLAAVVAVLGLGWYGYGLTQRPPSPRAAIEAFQGAWNRGDHAAIGALAKAGSTDRFEGSVARAQKRYDWGSEMPQLDAGAWSEPDGDTIQLQVTYVSDSRDLPVRFSLLSERWCLTGIDYSEVKHWRP